MRVFLKKLGITKGKNRAKNLIHGCLETLKKKDPTKKKLV